MGGQSGEWVDGLVGRWAGGQGGRWAGSQAGRHVGSSIDGCAPIPKVGHSVGHTTIHIRRDVSCFTLADASVLSAVALYSGSTSHAMD